MHSICLYLHVHQPFRYREYSVFDISNNKNYWNDPNFDSKQNNERIFKKVAKKSYYPMFSLIEENLKKHKDFKISLSITGTWLEQAELWAPDLIQLVKRLVETGRVEIVGETFYHSLAFFYDKNEFEDQVSLHAEKINQLFGVKPKIFRNTEFAYNDELAKWADEAGYKGILAEGWDRILGWRSSNHVYRPFATKNIKLLLKNYRLSDDIAFRFSDKKWSEWPLTVEKYLSWLETDILRGDLINLFMDFETFGEHQWADTGIFNFIDHLISSWLKNQNNQFVTVSEACDLEKPVDEISMPETITWADTERDLSAWTGNRMQKEALTSLYKLRDKVLASKDKSLIEDFRRLSTSDQAYYMCTKYWNDGDVHAYFSAYDTPYDAFMYYMNVLRDLEIRLTN